MCFLSCLALNWDCVQPGALPGVSKHRRQQYPDPDTFIMTESNWMSISKIGTKTCIFENHFGVNCI